MIAKILFVVGGAIVLLGFILCPWLDLFGKITGLDLLRSNLTVRDPITGALNVGLFLLGIVPIAGSFDVGVGYMQHPTRLLAVVAVILSIIGGISLANWAKDMNGSLGISYGFWVSVAGLIVAGVGGLIKTIQGGEVPLYHFLDESDTEIANDA